MKKKSDQPEDLRRLHIEQWQVSGMSQAEYCRLFGLKAHQFQYWRRKYEPVAAVGNELVQVPILFQPDVEPAEKPIANTVPPPSGIQMLVEGVIVQISRGFDPATLKQVLAVLGGGNVA